MRLMSGKNDEEIRGIIREIVEKLGYECVGVALVFQGRARYLRIFIDSIGGILVKDCETVSRAVSRFLDEHEELIPGAFYLEVSSPGLERPLFSLEDYGKFVGKQVQVRLHRAFEGQKKISGTLEGVEENTVLLKENESGALRRVPFEAISKGQLVFEETKRKKRRGS